MPPFLVTALFALILQFVAPHSTIALPRVAEVTDGPAVEQPAGDLHRRPKWW